MKVSDTSLCSLKPKVNGCLGAFEKRSRLGEEEPPSDENGVHVTGSGLFITGEHSNLGTFVFGDWKYTTTSITDIQVGASCPTKIYFYKHLNPISLELQLNLLLSPPAKAPTQRIVA